MYRRAVMTTLMLSGALACSGATDAKQAAFIDHLPRPLTQAESQLVDADNRFAFKLFHDIAGRDADSNLFISPLSVAMALGMTLNGANGATQEAMQQTLELGGLTREQVNQSYRGTIDLLRNLDARVQFSIANSIW